MASVVQVLTGVGVIIAYNRSRKRAGTGTICGKFAISDTGGSSIACSICWSGAQSDNLG